MFTSEATQTRKKRMNRMTKLAEISELDFDIKRKSAVLFITCQNEFLDPKGKLYSRVENVMTTLKTREHLKELLEAASASDALVIHAPVEIDANTKYGVGKGGFDEWQLSSETGVFTPGTWGVELYKDTSAGPGDIILAGRKGASCVTGTNLVTSLKNHQIDRLFVAGLLSDVTVENTVIELAEELKGTTIIHPVSDATAAFTIEAQKNTFDFVLKKCSEPVSTTEAVAMLATTH